MTEDRSRTLHTVPTMQSTSRQVQNRRSSHEKSACLYFAPYRRIYEGTLMQNDSADANYTGVAALLDRLVTSRSLPGASVLIHRSGEEVLYHEAGVSDVASGNPVARDTLFRLFSMTKPITAAAVMTLVDDGVSAWKMRSPTIFRNSPTSASTSARTATSSNRRPPARSRSGTCSRTPRASRTGSTRTTRLPDFTPKIPGLMTSAGASIPRWEVTMGSRDRWPGFPSSVNREIGGTTACRSTSPES